MKQFTFDGITITGDGMTVTARHYVNGELTCSAEAQPNPWDEYNFLSVAADALYKLKDKEQGSSTVEYCRADVDDAPIEDSSEEASENKASEYPKIYQSAVDIANESQYTYYEGRPDVFWEDFKVGKFIIHIHKFEWDKFAKIAALQNVYWASGDPINEWTPGFNRDYITFHGICNTGEAIYVGANSLGDVMHGITADGFDTDIVLEWSEVKLHD